MTERLTDQEVKGMEAALPPPEVYACDPDGWVLANGDDFHARRFYWLRLDQWDGSLVGSEAHYNDNPSLPLRLYGKMGGDERIIPIGRLVDTTDTPHYTPLTLEECVEFGLSPLCRDYDGIPQAYTPPATEPAPTTGIKHDADKPTWWLMPWVAVERIARGGAINSVFRAYSVAAGRTLCAVSWAQLGRTIIDAQFDGIDDAKMWAAFEQVHKVLEYGAAKYDAHNWQKVLQGENGPQRYIEACRRHLMADAAGEVNDAESGLPHWAHALCCCLFLIYNAEAGCEK